mgnify:CR=1 FL=1
MADTLIQERYSLDFDANAATERLAALSKEADRLRVAIDKAKQSGQEYARTQEQLNRVEQQFLNILNEEVTTYDGIVAKRKILAANLKTLEKGTAEYKARLSQVNDLEKREANTITGLNLKISELRAKRAQLEIGTRSYLKVSKELSAAESKAAKATGDLTKGSGSFTQAIRGGIAAIGLTVGIQQVIQYGKEALQASAEKQQQKSALLTALNNQEDVQERLLAQADALEANTLVDDDDIIALDRYLSSLGLTEKQISSLNNASVQLAAVQGTTVRAAADKLIAAQSGQTKGIQKLVPEVRNLSKAQLAAGAAADLVAKKFAGSAEALTTGIIGFQNRIKDATENFKEGIGDAITGGIGNNVAAFSNLLGEGTEKGFSRFTTALQDTVKDIISIPAYAIASIKAVFAGIGAAFDYVSNRAKIAVLDAKEGFLEAQKFFGLERKGDLERISDIQRFRQVLQERNELGFFKTIGDAGKKAFDDALAGADAFGKAIKGEGTNTDTKAFLPTVKKDAEALKGSLVFLEAELAKLKEKLTKFTVADDKTALAPILQDIALLEQKIKNVKKLQDELLGKPIENFDQIDTTNIQAKTIADEQVKARIQEQFIREESANRLRVIEEEQTAALSAIALTTTQREAIEAEFQGKREQLAIETDRAITANAIKQKQLELLELQRTSTKPGENAEGIARIRAELAAMEAQLSALQNKEVKIDIKVDPDKKAKNEIKEIADASVALALAVSDAVQGIYDRQADRADAALEKQKGKLKDALSNSEDFTAEQIKIERDRLDQFQKEQEQAAAKAKAFQATQVVANTIIAVAKAAGQTGVGAPIAILGVLAALAGGFAAASALAENAFYEGTDYVPLGNNKKGRDTIPARLHEGEGVLQADKNKAYAPTFKAMRRGEIPADILNGFTQDWKGGSQYIPRSRRNALPESVSGTNVGASNQNFYFQAKLNTLEREAALQTHLLEKIEANSRMNKTTRHVKKQAGSAKRFV